jgi:hypothetical protein
VRQQVVARLQQLVVFLQWPGARQPAILAVLAVLAAVAPGDPGNALEYITGKAILPHIPAGGSSAGYCVSAAEGETRL